MKSLNSNSVFEGEERVFIICNDNKDIDGYHEVNIRLSDLIGIGSTADEINAMKQIGLLP